MRYNVEKYKREEKKSKDIEEIKRNFKMIVRVKEQNAKNL